LSILPCFKNRLSRQEYNSNNIKKNLHSNPKYDGIELETNHSKRQKILIEKLIKKNIKFDEKNKDYYALNRLNDVVGYEIIVGFNGRMWINSEKPEDIYTIYEILNTTRSLFSARSLLFD
jgi:ppGpp synthetase/RelA/SpoT-type nucleotidyltranferase